MSSYYNNNYSDFLPYYKSSRRWFREQGEEDYGYAAGMNIYHEDVTEILDLVERQYSSTYGELMFYGMSEGGISYIFRYIIYYTISNAGRYPGNELQKSYPIFNALQSQEPWIFNSLATTYLPHPRINYIIMTIIMFTLRAISTPQPL
jgi:hypothetical protein